MLVSWILLVSFFNVTYQGGICNHLKPSGKAALSMVVHSSTAPAHPSPTRSVPGDAPAASVPASASAMPALGHSSPTPSVPAHAPVTSVPAYAPSIPSPVPSVPAPVLSVPASPHATSVPSPATSVPTNAPQSPAPADLPSIPAVAHDIRSVPRSVIQSSVRRRSARKMSHIGDSAAAAVHSRHSSLTVGKPSEDPTSAGNTPSKLADYVPTHDQTPATYSKLVPLMVAIQFLTFLFNNAKVETRITRLNFDLLL